VADTSIAGESATFLAELEARWRYQDLARRRASRRLAAAAGVVVFHALFVTLLIFSEWFPLDTIERIDRRPLLWVLLPEASKIPKVTPPKPKLGTSGDAAATFVKPDVVQRQQEESNAINLGLAIGRSLACGANSYEYLSSKQRLACHHQPWLFIYDRYGNIVLYTNQRPPEEEEKLRPSDIQARERNTAPRCPTNADPNAPCLSDVINGSRR
jgi:hypothetical protein